MPPESGKDDKTETHKDEAAKESQDGAEKGAGEERPQETEEAGTQTDAKVRTTIST